MDPRPYHFEYRKPRTDNPTYESLKLYESIYQLDKFRKAVNPQSNLAHQEKAPKAQSQQMRRHQSFDAMNTNTKQNRYNRQKDGRQNSLVNSSMSQYGNNIMKHQMFEQNRVYQKQERGFNIINFTSKDYQPRLRNFPKFTLEHTLIDRKSSPESHGQRDQRE